MYWKQNERFLLYLFIFLTILFSIETDTEAQQIKISTGEFNEVDIVKKAIVEGTLYDTFREKWILFPIDNNLLSKMVNKEKNRIYAFLGGEVSLDNEEENIGVFYVAINDDTSTPSVFIEIPCHYDPEIEFVSGYIMNYTLKHPLKSLGKRVQKIVKKEKIIKKKFTLTFANIYPKPDPILIKQYSEEVKRTFEEYYDYIYNNPKKEMWLIDYDRTDIPYSEDMSHEELSKIREHNIDRGKVGDVKMDPRLLDSRLYQIPRWATLYAVPPEETSGETFVYVVETNILYRLKYNRHINKLQSPLHIRLYDTLDLTNLFRGERYWVPYDLEPATRYRFMGDCEDPRGWYFHTRDLLLKEGIKIDVPVRDYIAKQFGGEAVNEQNFLEYWKYNKKRQPEDSN